jgi:hypothetical protein
MCRIFAQCQHTVVVPAGDELFFEFVFLDTGESAHGLLQLSASLSVTYFFLYPAQVGDLGMWRVSAKISI